MTKKKDLTGMKFGKLTVVNEADRHLFSNVTWNCICDCGKSVSVRAGCLLSGNTKSCGSCATLKDLNGMRFGKLVVVSKAKSNNGAMWTVECDCGKRKTLRGGSLIDGSTKSCGCLAKEHGASTSKDFTGKRFGKLTAIEATKERKSKHVVWKCMCDCGNFAYVDTSNLGRTMSCGCISFSSQATILGYVQQKYKMQSTIDIKSEHYVSINRVRYFFDIAIVKDDKVIGFIEYDGHQHFYPVAFGGMSEKKAQRAYENTVKNDRAKDKYCEKHSIPLCRIPYTEYDNYESIVGRFIKQNRLQ